MKRFLFGFILISLFSSPVLAAGYSCPAYMKYTSCSAGYYMTNGGSYNGTPVSGNTCTTCPAGYTCAGGTANMVASTRSCAAGTYWNGSACANCGGDAYYCPGFSNISNPGSGYGRNGVSAGYYSTGGGATTRTGQAQCTAGSYCSAGVKYTCAAGTYSGAGAGACTACSGATQFQDATGQSGCKAVSTGYYKSSNAVQALCPAGYQVGAGAANQASCIGSFSKSGSQLAPALPANCASITATGACTPGTCTYQQNYAGTITSNCTPTNCAKPITGVTANGNYYANASSCSACPAGYPGSDAGNSGGVTKCFSSSKSRAWSGDQTACALPANCATVSCNACSVGACAYVAYANSAGTADGTIKSGCSTNSAACQQTVGGVTANGGAYINGTACSACPSGYASGAGASSQSGCSGSVDAGKYVATAGGASTACAAGTFKAAHRVNYGSLSSCAACTGTTYSGAGAGSCAACPAGYTANTASNKTAATQCQINVGGGQYMATAGSGGSLPCAAGTSKPAHIVNYGSLSSCAACTGGTYQNQTGQASCKACPAGSYCPSGAVTTIICPAGYICPAGSSAYSGCGFVGGYHAENGTGAGSTVCNKTAPANSYGVCWSNDTDIKTSTAVDINNLDGGGTKILPGYPGTATCGTYGDFACKPGYYRSSSANGVYSASGTACQTCPAGSYCSGGTASPATCTGATYSGAGAASCAACPAGYTANTASNKTAAAQCQISVGSGQYIATTNAGASTCPAGYSCAGGTINYGNTGIIMTCSAGTFSTVGSTGCSTCPVGSYSASSAGVCTACQGGLTTSAAGQSSCNATCSNKNDYASNWAAVTWANNSVSNLCALSGCSGGYYVAGNACVVAGAGYWSASGSGARTACDAGTTTIGSGAGADEAADCGRRLHIGDSILYLRSAKKTTPSLNVGVNGTVYYGNMTPGSSKGALRVNYGGTTYSVHDDSM